MLKNRYCMNTLQVRPNSQHLHLTAAVDTLLPGQLACVDDGAGNGEVIRLLVEVTDGMLESVQNFRSCSSCGINVCTFYTTGWCRPGRQMLGHYSTHGCGAFWPHLGRRDFDRAWFVVAPWSSTALYSHSTKQNLYACVCNAVGADINAKNGSGLGALDFVRPPSVTPLSAQGTTLIRWPELIEHWTHAAAGPIHRNGGAALAFLRTTGLAEGTDAGVLASHFLPELQQISTMQRFGVLAGFCQEIRREIERRGRCCLQRSSWRVRFHGGKFAVAHAARRVSDRVRTSLIQDATGRGVRRAWAACWCAASVVSSVVYRERERKRARESALER